MTNDQTTSPADSEAARLEECSSIDAHHERHPDECCNTYRGRGCCLAPAPGEVYLALCIENGGCFSTRPRAQDPSEAKELGRKAAATWGGECISVHRERQENLPDTDHGQAA